MAAKGPAAQISLPSARTSASSTSTPRLHTVLSILVCPRRIPVGQAERFAEALGAFAPVRLVRTECGHAIPPAER